MSEERIVKIRSMIDLGIGNTERLLGIINTLEKGNSLEMQDEIYLKELEDDLVSINQEKDNSGSYDDTISDKPTTKETSSVPYSTENTKPVKDDMVAKSNFRRKAAISGLIIGIVVISYAGLNVYAVSNLQFKPHSGNQYMISPTSVFIQSEVCNPSYFPASFNRYEINAFYKSQSVETAEITGSTISPKTFSVLDGKFILNQDTLMKLNQENASFDPTKAHITTTIYAPIFGIIPFSVVKDYSSDEFQQVLKNGPPGTFSCG